MFISPSDLAIAIGIKSSTLRQHIKRQKLFKSGKLIDTEFELNHEYIMGQTNGAGLNLDLIPLRKNTNSKSVPKVSPKIDIQSQSGVNKKPDIGNFETITMQRKAADLKKVELDMQLKELQLQKMQGKLIPLDLMESIFVINLQSIIRGMQGSNENIASIYCERLGGDRADLAGMIQMMQIELDKAVNDAKTKAAIEIKIAIKDYAETRNRGERK